MKNNIFYALVLLFMLSSCYSDSQLTTYSEKRKVVETIKEVNYKVIFQNKMPLTFTFPDYEINIHAIDPTSLDKTYSILNNLNGVLHYNLKEYSLSEVKPRKKQNSPSSSNNQLGEFLEMLLSSGRIDSSEYRRFYALILTQNTSINFNHDNNQKGLPILKTDDKYYSIFRVEIQNTSSKTFYVKPNLYIYTNGELLRNLSANEILFYSGDAIPKNQYYKFLNRVLL